jgi:hypothetical protein
MRTQESIQACFNDPWTLQDTTRSPSPETRGDTVDQAIGPLISTGINIPLQPMSGRRATLQGDLNVELEGGL